MRDGAPREDGPRDAGPRDGDSREAEPRAEDLRYAGLGAGPRDAGPRGAGTRDAGPRDANPRGAGPRDAGPRDAGPRDDGPRDAGPRGAGPRDAAPRDAGPRDHGLRCTPPAEPVSCGTVRRAAVPPDPVISFAGDEFARLGRAKPRGPAPDPPAFRAEGPPRRSDENDPRRLGVIARQSTTHRARTRGLSSEAARLGRTRPGHSAFAGEPGGSGRLDLVRDVGMARARGARALAHVHHQHGDVGGRDAGDT